MSPFKRHSLGTAVFSAVLLLATAQGCGDDDDNPKPPDVETGGSNTTGGKSSTAGSSNKGGKAGENTGNTDQGGNGPVTDGGSGNTDQGGSGNEGGGDNPPIPACTLPELGEDGCFNCPKDGEVEQWLNRCAEGDCVPFDNQARLPKLKSDGSLPDLPN